MEIFEQSVAEDVLIIFTNRNQSDQWSRKTGNQAKVRIKKKIGQGKKGSSCKVNEFLVVEALIISFLYDIMLIFIASKITIITCNP